MEDNNSWLKKAIAQGFMMLAALNLKGRPASADLTAVAELWLGILSGRSWQPEQDGIRIQAAFRAIAASSSEWPNPADLIKHLPPPEISAEIGKEAPSDRIRQSTGRQTQTDTQPAGKFSLHEQGLDTRATPPVGG